MWLIIVLDANKEEMKEKHLALQWLPLYVGKNPNCLPLLTLTWPEDENPPKQNQCSDNQYKEGDQGLEIEWLKRQSEMNNQNIAIKIIFQQKT